jgi:predicted acetyltransferase
MPLKLRWVGIEERELVAQTRWACYSHAGKDLKRFTDNIAMDPWSGAGDYLLAERDGAAVGTASNIPFRMWICGAPVSCQGVAYVGTAKAARRRAGTEPGVASVVMNEVIRAARERAFVVTALMPFRASFYEHFGYGLVERRFDWTIPMAILPTGDPGEWRLAGEADRPAQIALWQTAVEAGHCDVERSLSRWEHHRAVEEEGMTFIERPTRGGPARASALIVFETAGSRAQIRVQEWSADGPESFLRLLHFLGTMKDQFSSAAITTSADILVNRLLREPQVPHRPVEHPTAEVRDYTRMQVRVLNHAAFLESLHLPTGITGRTVVGVRETEGNISRFSMELEGGRIAVKPSAESPQLECPDHTWAAIATGDLPVSFAVQHGLATASSAAFPVLEALWRGPKPFCREVF